MPKKSGDGYAAPIPDEASNLRTAESIITDPAPLDPNRNASDEQKEKERLDRMGVKSDDDQVRGVNIKADGIHNTDPLYCPPKVEAESDGGEGQLKVNNVGDTVPSRELSRPAPLAQPNPPAPPAPAPAPVPFVSTDSPVLKID